MNIEKLTQNDWELLAENKTVLMSFGVEEEEIIKKETRSSSSTSFTTTKIIKNGAQLGKDLSKKAYGGKFKHSPGIIESKEQIGQQIYVLFGDLIDEPMCILRRKDDKLQILDMEKIPYEEED
ncbi:MAG: hypothetical protein AMQ74_01662 [Candidatus Methanofastidiosum methylothiophilum]|uniref:Uncharacterized protein n=1 Tax=Candidatus Methanofastidiosum methylothiophilum TaxID=1705564 RepID=A0A150IRT9_9EURY|nr:MAG: hypothetical protein AMQ74_01662 [Candidatus Methanofastidiosum methylthiophilus]